MISTDEIYLLLLLSMVFWVFHNELSVQLVVGSDGLCNGNLLSFLLSNGTRPYERGTQ